MTHVGAARLQGDCIREEKARITALFSNGATHFHKCPDVSDFSLQNNKAQADFFIVIFFFNISLVLLDFMLLSSVILKKINLKMCRNCMEAPASRALASPRSPPAFPVIKYQGTPLDILLVQQDGWNGWGKAA